MLKLDFNERSDKRNSITNDYSFGEDLWQYPNRQPLENQIAEENNLSPTQVLVTNGGDEAIMLLMRLIKFSGQLILPLPAFSQYTQGIKSWSIESSLISPDEDLRIDIPSIKASVLKLTNAVTILTRPNNPTGELIAIDDLLDLLECSKLNNNWVFLDEAYIEFAFDNNQTLSLLSQFDNLVILRTLSKAYGLAGIRVGYLLGSEKVISQFKAICLTFNVSAPNLIIASQALKNNNDMESYCSVIRKNRQKLLDWLSDAGIPVINSKANFILLKLSTGQAQAIKSFLSKNDILVRTFFEDNLKNCLRITIPFNLNLLFKLLKQVLKPKLVCLDMDGVLINTSKSYDQSIKATIKYFSKKDILQKDIDKLRNSGGYNNDWLLSQKLLAKMKIDIDLVTVTDIFQDYYLGTKGIVGFQLNETALINSNFAKKISTTKTLSFAIVTGRPLSEAKAGQNKLELNNITLISLDDVSIGKPSPEGIKKLQAIYSNSSWMVGDNPDDMQAACASNSLAIGIAKNNQKSLYDAGADIVLENINQMESWLCL